MPLTVKDLYNSEQSEKFHPGEYYTIKESQGFFGKTVIQQNFKISPFIYRKSYDFDYSEHPGWLIEFSPIIKGSSSRTPDLYCGCDIDFHKFAINPNQIFIFDSNLKQAFSAAQKLEDGYIGVIITVAHPFVAEKLATPVEYGQINLYLKFNYEKQLRGVKIEETFQNKTTTVFIANDLKPVSELVLKAEARKIATEKAAEEELLRKFKF